MLGLGGGLLGLVAPWAGRVAGTLAAWCVAWIVLVARRGAGLPAAAVDWGTGVVPLVVLTLVSVGIAVARRTCCGGARPASAAACCSCWRSWSGRPTPGWPPDGWLMVACDVGQGDALVLRAGPGPASSSTPGPTRPRSTPAWTGWS